MLLAKPFSVSAGDYSLFTDLRINQQQETPTPTDDGFSLRDDLCPITDLDCEGPAGSFSGISIANEESLQNADVILILFWMEDCAHCEEVLTTILPDIQTIYQDQVAVFPIELKEIETIDTFYNMAERLEVSKNDIGVPLVIIGDQVLTGDEIKQDLIAQIDKNLQVDDYRLLSIPEFENQLPATIQSLETITTANQTSSNKRLFLIGSIIGISAISMIIVVVIRTRKKQSD
jgi:hypothetical protein